MAIKVRKILDGVLPKKGGPVMKKSGKGAAGSGKGAASGSGKGAASGSGSGSGSGNAAPKSSSPEMQRALDNDNLQGIQKAERKALTDLQQQMKTAGVDFDDLLASKRKGGSGFKEKLKAAKEKLGDGLGKQLLKGAGVVAVGGYYVTFAATDGEVDLLRELLGIPIKSATGATEDALEGVGRVAGSAVDTMTTALENTVEKAGATAGRLVDTAGASLENVLGSIGDVVGLPGRWMLLLAGGALVIFLFLRR